MLTHEKITLLSKVNLKVVLSITCQNELQLSIKGCQNLSKCGGELTKDHTEKRLSKQKERCTVIWGDSGTPGCLRQVFKKKRLSKSQLAILTFVFTIFRLFIV